MNLRTIFKKIFAITLLTIFLTPAIGLAQESRPNIIMILSDDHGWADLECYGAKDLSTPVLDKMAMEGIQFMDSYVTAPQCTPSRCGLITGVYQQRIGLEANPDMKYYPVFGFQDGFTSTFAGLLQKEGYRTGMVGKWHIGETLDSQPFSNGFEWCRYMRGGMGYFWPANQGRQDLLNETEVWGTDAWWGEQFRNEKDEVIPWTEGYITDVFTDNAIDFVSGVKKDERPFFLYLAYNAPHTPLEAPQEIVDSFDHIDDMGRRIYAAMVKSLDSNIGRLFEHLEKLGVEENTFVVFMSDNGAPKGPSLMGYNHGSNGPLRGFKGQLYEGGVRVPMIFKWPAKFVGGQKVDWSTISVDLLPTFLAAAGTSVPNEKDGQNLLPFLTPEVSDMGPQHTAYWRYLTKWARQFAIRDDNWKLISPDGKQFELYDIYEDKEEKTDLSVVHPEIKTRLHDELNEWMKELPERPKWIDKLAGEE
jgi:arylsulfatase A-like enzyme